MADDAAAAAASDDIAVAFDGEVIAASTAAAIAFVVAEATAKRAAFVAARPTVFDGVFVADIVDFVVAYAVDRRKLDGNFVFAFVAASTFVAVADADLANHVVGTLHNV